MARGRWYRAADSTWRWVDAVSGTPALKKIRIFQASSGLWRRAAQLRFYRAATGLWYTVRTGYPPTTPTDAPPHDYLGDFSICTNPSPRTETWNFNTVFTISAVYVGIYKLQVQFTRGGTGQGWNDLTGGTIDGSGNNLLTASVTGSWSSGAPHGTLGTGTGYATVLWGIEARFVDLDSGNIGPSNGDGTTNQIALILPYC